MSGSTFSAYSAFIAKRVQEDLKEDVALVPHDHDVLCGRGGLTNHHLGNTWYRRLVRSNRALYKKSPKHTKLLVSKAIVHHVQNQNPSGRFLECHRTTGCWSAVPYKRAVDKTSQALREREREGEDNDDDDDNDEHLTSINGMPPRMSELAQAAVAQANMLHPKIALPPPPTNKSNALAQSVRSSLAVEVPPPPGEVNKRPLERGSSWFGFAAKRQKVEDDPIPLPTVPLQQRSSSIFRFFQTSSLFGGSQTPAPAIDTGLQQSLGYPHFQPAMSSNSALNQSVLTGNQMQHANIHQAISTVSHAGTQNFGPGTTLNSQMTVANFAQMMSDASLRDSHHFAQAPSNGSLLGLIQQGLSQDLPHVFNSNLNSIFNQGNILSTPASYGYSTSAGQMQLAYATQQFPSNSSQDYDEQLQSCTKLETTSSTAGNSIPYNDGQNFIVSQEFEPRPLAGDLKQGGEVPGLTRFTTQVSDWLTSFWPLQREQSSEISQQQAQEHQQLERNNMNQKFSDDNLQGQQEAVQAQMQNLGRFQQQQMEHIGSVQRRQQTQQQTSRTGDGNPQPTQLSQSVSSTFLKLATNPSRIFSGLSTFFDRNQNPSQIQSLVTAPCSIHTNIGMSTGNSLQHDNIDIGGNQSMSNNTLGIQIIPSVFMENQSMALKPQNSLQSTGKNFTSLIPPAFGQTISGTKAAASRSLLDDYEDTPMELRLRTVASR